MAILLLWLLCTLLDVAACISAPYEETCVCFEQLTDIDIMLGPNHINSLGDGSGKLYVANHYGAVSMYQVETGERLPGMYLDVGAVYNYNYSYMSFYTFTFHPNYAENGRVFVFYNIHNWDGTANVTVGEFRRDEDNPDYVDFDSFREILVWHEIREFHNGGGVSRSDILIVIWHNAAKDI